MELRHLKYFELTIHMVVVYELRKLKYQEFRRYGESAAGIKLGMGVIYDETK